MSMATVVAVAALFLCAAWVWIPRTSGGTAGSRDRCFNVSYVGDGQDHCPIGRNDDRQPLSDKDGVEVDLVLERSQGLFPGMANHPRALSGARTWSNQTGQGYLATRFPTSRGSGNAGSRPATSCLFRFVPVSSFRNQLPLFELETESPASDASSSSLSDPGPDPGSFARPGSGSGMDGAPSVWPVLGVSPYAELLVPESPPPADASEGASTGPLPPPVELPAGVPVSDSMTPAADVVDGDASDPLPTSVPTQAHPVNASGTQATSTRTNARDPVATVRICSRP